jgi:hypothetical protein
LFFLEGVLRFRLLLFVLPRVLGGGARAGIVGNAVDSAEVVPLVLVSSVPVMVVVNAALSVPV